MHSHGKPHKRILPALLAALALCLLLTACAAEAPAPEAEPEPSPTPTVDPLFTEDAEKIRIAELMGKNRAILQDEDGDFSDWIELENCSDTAVDLGGWRLSDKENRAGWTLPTLELKAGERLLIFADGKDRAEGLHANFSLSAGETLYLYNSHGCLASSAPCGDGTADTSMALDGDGGYAPSRYPTPGRPNTQEGYAAWQESLKAEGPLVINEVVVSNLAGYYVYLVGESDWVELSNISDEPVELSDYFLSDDHNDYCLWQLPAFTLQPGCSYLISCNTEGSYGSAPCCTRFSLSADTEQLYLARADGTLADYVSLRDIPYKCSYGRMEGKNGWFYFDAQTPGRENSRGYRRVADKPAAAEPDGVYDNVDAVTVTLEAPGTIYYTTDGTLPTAASPIYTKPLQLRQTTVVRAINWETGAMPSQALTLSYIINEGHSLPVASLVSDDKLTFNGMYYTGSKGIETPGSLSFYEPDGSFTIPCGIKMQGGTSLELPKKNMSMRFRSVYGQEKLNYDLFDGGVSSFTNLLLRSGQDYYYTIIRNELCLNLALSASDHLVTQRNRYCVLYVDGKYYGIYALMEKSNEQMYADWLGVSRESVVTVDADNTLSSELSEDLFSFCLSHDMTKPENYDYFCQRMDVDSMIDWFLLEGFCANGDLTYGNLRYCRSSEGDGKWRFMFYDLDAAFHEAGLNYYNLFSNTQMYNKQICTVLKALLENKQFRDRMLTRAGELLRDELTNDKVMAELERLAKQVEPEVARDYAHLNLEAKDWSRHMQQLRDFIEQQDWRTHNIEALCEIFQLDAAQRLHYFGA